MDLRIERLQRQAAQCSGVLSLAGGLPLTSLLPTAALLGSVRELSPDQRDEALQYGWPEGSDALRAWVADGLRARGARVDASDVLITSGAQQALSLLVFVLGLNGQRVCVDPLTYPGALDLFRHHDARLVTEGCARVRYVVPGVSNPTGLGMAGAERQHVLGAPADFLIADEAYAELRYDGLTERPLFLDAPERVFHVGTLSKTLWPGLRVGWIVAPPSFRAELLDAKRDADLQAPSLTQALAVRILATLDWRRHLECARSKYVARIARLMHSVRRRLPEFSCVEPEGGFSLFLQCRERRLDEMKLLEAATRLGTSFDPGRMFRANADGAGCGLRLSPCNVPEELIDEAVRRLSRAVAVCRNAQ